MEQSGYNQIVQIFQRKISKEVKRDKKKQEDYINTTEQQKKIRIITVKKQKKLLEIQKKRKEERKTKQKQLETDIDKEWKLIDKTIQAVASKYIPSTKIQDSKSQIRKEATKSIIYSHIKMLE